VADSLADGNTRVAYVPAISNQASPTTTELNAGILLQSIMTADGLEGYEASTADVDNSALDSTFDTITIGRDSFSGTMLRFKKQTGTDTVYDTLVRGVTGYIVIRRDTASSTGWASSQKVEVYPVICGQARFLKPEPNSIRKYEVPTKITSSPTLRATIA
jgi:hypothetical protein